MIHSGLWPKRAASYNRMPSDIRISDKQPMILFAQYDNLRPTGMVPAGKVSQAGFLREHPSILETSLFKIQWFSSKVITSGVVSLSGFKVSQL